MLKKDIALKSPYGLYSKTRSSCSFSHRSFARSKKALFFSKPIALVHLCYESKDYLLMPAPDFIKQGIYQSVIDAFGVNVADFVKEI
ncbi:hypothetical protein N7638_05635 [Achromobacter mucicolens]|uniref:hypothetical protein n=1 Tax=Achromobacter mucicolens TaxID=1389922 RepID=UPI00244C7718|nr:hypothetical protein [Achromobacter mucicolens]MDG9967505.1 hypothetical protein [Achromobacter mucicolens]